MLTITRDTPTRQFDAIIIGTGPCGGFAAKELTERGMDVLVLDAGPIPVAGRDFARHEWPWQQPGRGLAAERRRPERPSDRVPLLWARHPDHPFTTEPGKPFTWIRSRMVGGRSLH
ncbi:MAG: hypothetical protein FJW31_00840 [Acidobacteria bacterium]|nr:hypothetical protein [Acidobacteriota bacterium]